MALSWGRLLRFALSRFGGSYEVKADWGAEDPAGGYHTRLWHEGLYGGVKLFWDFICLAFTFFWLLFPASGTSDHHLQARFATLSYLYIQMGGSSVLLYTTEAALE